MNFLIRPLFNNVMCHCNKLLTIYAREFDLKLMSELTFELAKKIYEEVKTDVERNEEALENLKVQAVDLK